MGILGAKHNIIHANNSMIAIFSKMKHINLNILEASPETRRHWNSVVFDPPSDALWLSSLRYAYPMTNHYFDKVDVLIRFVFSAILAVVIHMTPYDVMVLVTCILCVWNDEVEHHGGYLESLYSFIWHGIAVLERISSVLLSIKLCLGGGQSSPFNSRSQARIKEEGWCQEGHPAIKHLL